MLRQLLNYFVALATGISTVKGGLVRGLSRQLPTPAGPFRFHLPCHYWLSWRLPSFGSVIAAMFWP